jgi:predicted DNA-binding antitoxin AbrB/MazE fold protein
MSQIVTAIFENGLLKPDVQLHLSPGARVRLTVEPIEAVPASNDRAWEELEELWEAALGDSNGKRFTRDQLHDRR